MNVHLDSWTALAPGLETKEDWQQWLHNPVEIQAGLDKVSLPDIPAMLRRRFSTFGRYAIAAAMQLVKRINAIPSIFASRHGDTELTFNQLRSIGQNEPMSPTSFSLSVHNAVTGLFSIARKDTSTVTAIAAIEGLVLQTFFEAIGQLQQTEKVFCVVYDTPLPDFYRQHSCEVDSAFPYAIAMILNRVDGEAFSLEPAKPVARTESGPGDSEPMQLLSLLTGMKDETLLQQNGGAWRMARVTS